MSQDMLGVVADFVTKLRSGAISETQAKKFLRGENPFGEAVQEKIKLLKHITQIEVGDTTRFVVGDHFKTKQTPDGVQLYWLGENVQRNFLDKIEKPGMGCRLQKSQLTKACFDRLIIGELGERATTTIAHLWGLLKKQPKGEEGVLLVNGYANIFYVEDVHGIIRTVYAYWFVGEGWYIFARSNEDGRWWDSADAIFSR